MQTVTIRGEELLLHPEKGIFWPAQSILFLADLHLGKGAHFRRAGIAVPLGVSQVNFARLRQMITEFSPERVLLLGDVFHSHYNHVWDDFENFLYSFPEISFELVPGNHDILPAAAYETSLLTIQPGYFEVPPFYLTHYPQEADQIPPHLYCLCGHLHPCVVLHDGNSRNGLKLPCFYFGANQGILPAFGEFTGCAEVNVKAGDQVFVLAEGEVIGVT